MTLKDIEDTIGKNTLSYSKISASDLVSIMEYVKVKLLMDRECFDYYYEIETDELLSSKMPTELLSVLQDLGWAFNSDKSKILSYLKNG